jgi:predicted  nucleic acid-binding Zn-ribbon protein
MTRSNRSLEIQSLKTQEVAYKEKTRSLENNLANIIRDMADAKLKSASEVQSLNGKLEVLSLELSRINANPDLQDKIKHLLAQVSNQKEKISSVETNIVNTTKEISDLKNLICTKKTLELQESFKLQEGMVTSLKDKIHLLESSLVSTARDLADSRGKSDAELRVVTGKMESLALETSAT